MKNNAFTLAEVLITLGVIGVVAALVMPPVIKNYQQQVTINKLKKFYTNMNQVLAMAKNDYGDYSAWDKELTSVEFVNKYIKPYIKNVSRIETNIHIHGDMVDGVRIIFADGTSAIFSNSSQFMTLWVGADVSDFPKKAIRFYTSSYSKDYMSSKDLKHPTHERFYFVINDNGFLLPPGMQRSRDDNLKYCTQNYTTIQGVYDYGNNGHVTCSTVIYKDNWQIKSDYPW